MRLATRERKRKEHLGKQVLQHRVLRRDQYVTTGDHWPPHYRIPHTPPSKVIDCTTSVIAQGLQASALSHQSVGLH